MTSARELPVGRDAHLDVEGERGDPSSYRSGDPSCISGVRLDCDGGANAAIYFHIRSKGAYRYIDYWFYYRFNDAPLKRLFAHESDWEGVVVAVPRVDENPNTFDFVALAAHNSVYRYLREALRCDGKAGSCGDTAKRVAVFVARGTHASYPQPCAGVGGKCRQNSAPWLENRFDGAAAWGGNQESQRVRALPVHGWATWGGAWDPRRKVRSPGKQPRFRDPSVATCISRWHATTAGACLTPEGKRDPCASWFGPLTTAVACNAGRLTQSLASGGLRASSRIEMRVFHGRTAAVDGLTQGLGEPAMPGVPVEIRGEEVPADRLYVRARNDDYVALARFDSLALRETGIALIEVTGRRGEPRIEIVPQGNFANPPIRAKPTAVVFIKR
jgi:hypothetical protein